MKTKLLLLVSFIFVTTNAEATTYEINWQFGYHGTLNIELGDTVRWNYTGFHDVTSSGSPTFPNGPMQSGGSYEYTFNTIGTYYYFCSVHGAANQDGTINVQETLSIDEANPLDIFSLYPNPSSYELNLKLPESSENYDIEVFNVLGKKVHALQTMNPTKVRVEDWENGVYFIRVIYNKKHITKVFVKNESS